MATPGSSFSVEAANMGNTTVITKHFGVSKSELYNRVDSRVSPPQGDCEVLPPPSRSILIPPDVCSAPLVA